MRHERAIRRGFDYFRERHQTIERLGEGRHVTDGLDPDQSVILATTLDALAQYWAGAWRPELNDKYAPKGVRMHEFLMEHGRREIFERVSGPHLVRRAQKKDRRALVPEVLRVYGDDGWDDRIRSWRDDLTLTELLGDPGVAAAGGDTRFIEKSLYGHLLYRDFRCSWVHEMMPGDVHTRPFASSDGADEPHYGNEIARGWLHIERRPTFPAVFLLDTLVTAIDRFEARCLADDRNPFVSGSSAQESSG